MSTIASRAGHYDSLRGDVAVTLVAGEYVAAWLIGLLVAPTAPNPTATAAAIDYFYGAHAPAILLQSSLVHGVAGVCLAALAVLLTRPREVIGEAGPRTRKLARIAGLLAATVSMFQVAFAAAACYSAGHSAADTTRSWFLAINEADTLKLVLLAVFVAAVSWSRTESFLRYLGAVLVITLPLGGMAFLFSNRVLTAILTVSLPLLLLWAASVGVLALRGGTKRAVSARA